MLYLLFFFHNSIHTDSISRNRKNIVQADAAHFVAKVSEIKSNYPRHLYLA